MAKKRAEMVEDTSGGDQLPTFAAVDSDDPEAVQLIVPIGQTANGEYISNYLEIRMTTDQCRALRLLRHGLTASPHRLVNDKRVESDADAVRWLLERVAEKMAG